MEEVEAKDIEGTTSEVEAKAEVDQNIIMQQSSGDLHKIKLKEADPGENIMSNVINASNLGIMKMNAKRNSEIRIEAMSISPTMCQE